jgi:hypothetical protein
MSNCPNCGAKLSCGCQKRTLANGKQGCTNCSTKTVSKTTTETTVKSNTWGPNRYKNLDKFIKK